MIQKCQNLSSSSSFFSSLLVYRYVQLDFTPEMEVYYMLFERCHTKNSKRSIKQHMKYFNFWSKIQLDHPVEISCCQQDSPSKYPVS